MGLFVYGWVFLFLLGRLKICALYIYIAYTPEQKSSKKSLVVLSLLLLFAVSSLSMFSAPSASATGVGAAVEVFPGPRPVSSYAPLSVLFSVLCFPWVSRLSSLVYLFLFFLFFFFL
jgi:hypothetical protein